MQEAQRALELRGFGSGLPTGGNMRSSKSGECISTSRSIPKMTKGGGTVGTDLVCLKRRRSSIFPTTFGRQSSCFAFSCFFLGDRLSRSDSHRSTLPSKSRGYLKPTSRPEASSSNSFATASNIGREATPASWSALSFPPP